MYDEAADFQHHKSEIDAVVSLLGMLGMRLRPEWAVLDLGAGQGMHAGFLAALVARVYCADIIDYSSLYNGEFLKLLKEKHGRNGFDLPLERVAFHQADAMRLLYRDSLFDAVVSINAFEHIPDPKKALAEVIRVTKADGLMYISADPIWTADTGSHFFHRVPEPWAQLAYSDEHFIAKMQASGASEFEIHEYRYAMNRWPAPKYHEAVADLAARGLVDVVHHDSWSGVADDRHLQADSLQTLTTRGFSREELLIRGLRWVLRKR